MKSSLCLVLFLVVITCAGGLWSEQNVRDPDLHLAIPMRDGVELEADVYLPTADARSLPCVLIRSPRGHVHDRRRYNKIAEWGYAVVIQDTRLRSKTGSPIMPYFTDGWGELQDGYDTVEWLAKHPICDGQVATVGESAVGITQLLLAPSAPPSLKCQYISIAAPSLYHHAIFPGGQILKDQVEGWMGSYSDSSYFMGLLARQPRYNEFWARFDSCRAAHQVKVPGIHIGGWFDTFCQGTIDAFVSRHEKGAQGARGRQKLVIGPWTHNWPRDPRLGDFAMPSLGVQAPVDVSMKSWLEAHLKGKADGFHMDVPTVMYYVMGPFDESPSTGNVWRHSDAWPVPATQTAFYLNGDGVLTDNSLELVHKDYVAFNYDPDDPVPTVGGRNLFLESGPKDQRSVEARDDVVLFTSEPLTEDLEVTGRIRARIFFKTDQRDTDVVVKLCDVYPDGRSVLICDGLARLAVVSSEEAIAGRGPVPVDVDLWSTAMVFAKGHRLRVSITSSNYPRFEKNLNLGLLPMQGATPKVAHNEVYFGERFSSRIILPVVRRGGDSAEQVLYGSPASPLGESRSVSSSLKS